jgi:hypothetical protein
MRTAWRAASAGAVVGAILDVSNHGLVISADGIAHVLGGAMALAVVFGIIGYVIELRACPRPRRQLED